MKMKNTLLIDFYTEVSSSFSPQNQESFNCTIRLNAEHSIYKGHFEQVPIAPGVCLTQIVKEILMDKFRKELVMTQGDNIKFLAMINPNETPDLNIAFTVKSTENGLEASAIYSHNGTTYVKFKGKFSALK